MKYFIGLLCVVSVVLSALLTEGIRRQSSDRDCKENIKNIATALEMYSTDHAGRFPPTLGHLAPDYLGKVPTCPSTQTVVYDYQHQM